MAASFHPEVPVLDKGFVRLVDSMGGDLSVVRAARVSHSAQWRSGDDEGSDAKLLAYLMRHGHTSPFEHVVFTFEVKAPFFVLRQWHRHRTWSYNEESARYKENTGEFYIPDPKRIGVADPRNKQGRLFVGIEDPGASDSIDGVSGMAVKGYLTLLDMGVPREVARMVLPLNTYSTMFATVDLHNLLHFFELRDDPHAQWEIAEYARAMEHLVEPIVPVCFAAWKKEKGRNGT